MIERRKAQRKKIRHSDYAIGNVTTGYKIFTVLNFFIMLIMVALCIFPVLNILAISFSSQVAVASGKVWFWPVNPTLISYEYMIGKKEFWDAMMVSIRRLVLGGFVNMLLCILAAYPLSKSKAAFPQRDAYVVYILITMMFSGGLVPSFFVVKYTGIMDTIWALILPMAVPVYNVIILMNFFRQLPKEMEEAAFIDGAGHWQVLWKIVLPTSLPGLATVGLFIMVSHWNEWFSGMIYMKSVRNYPLQTYIRSIILEGRFDVRDIGDLEIIKHLSNRTISSAQLFIGMIPILVVYPFLQKHFTKGLVLGSVKG